MTKFCRERARSILGMTFVVKWLGVLGRDITAFEAA